MIGWFFEIRLTLQQILFLLFCLLSAPNSLFPTARLQTMLMTTSKNSFVVRHTEIHAFAGENTSAGLMHRAFVVQIVYFLRFIREMFLVFTMRLNAEMR